MTEEAAEMTGCGRRGKPKPGFPRPTTSPLEIAPRDFHIPAAPTYDRHGKVEIQQQDSHFPTAHCPVSKIKNERRSIPAC
jgi:hypothetical protein